MDDARWFKIIRWNYKNKKVSPDSFHTGKPIRLCKLLHLQDIIASGSSGLQKWNWCRLLFSPNQHQPLFLGIVRNQYVLPKLLIHGKPTARLYYAHTHTHGSQAIVAWKIFLENPICRLLSNLPDEIIRGFRASVVYITVEHLYALSHSLSLYPCLRMYASRYS